MPNEGFCPWLFFVLIKIGRAAAKLQPEEEEGRREKRKEKKRREQCQCIMHGQQWPTRTPSSIGDSYTIAIATAGVASAAISSDRCRCCNRGDNITVSGAAPRPPRARADLRPSRRGSPTRPDDLHATLLRLERFSRRISSHGRIHRLCCRDGSRIARARAHTQRSGVAA